MSELDGAEACAGTAQARLDHVLLVRGFGMSGVVGGCACGRYICGCSRPGAAPEQLPALAGAALLCSAPGTGNDALVQRIAKKSFFKAAKLTWCARCTLRTSAWAACVHPAVSTASHTVLHTMPKNCMEVDGGCLHAGRW